MAYEKSEVPVARSQEGIRKLVMSHKGFGIAFVSQRDPQGGELPREGFEAKVTITSKPTVIRIMCNLKLPGKYWSETQKQIFTAQEERRVWRVLYWHLKGVFEASDSGVMEFRELMLPYIVMPNNRTVAEILLPMLATRPDRLLAAAGTDALDADIPK